MAKDDKKKPTAEDLFWGDWRKKKDAPTKSDGRFDERIIGEGRRHVRKGKKEPNKSILEMVGILKKKHPQKRGKQK